jgi:acyl-CoA thioester hydrolase
MSSYGYVTDTDARYARPPQEERAIVDQAFELPLAVRYAEVDQQGVVFNAHYLTWFDEAFTAFLAHRELPYPDLIATGTDVMLVRTEIDWKGGVGWGEEVAVAVSTAHLGRSSFTLDFEVRRAGRALVLGRTVYVCVDTGSHGPRGIPQGLRAALGEPAPLRPLGGS